MPNGDDVSWPVKNWQFLVGMCSVAMAYGALQWQVADNTKEANSLPVVRTQLQVASVRLSTIESLVSAFQGPIRSRLSVVEGKLAVAQNSDANIRARLIRIERKLDSVIRIRRNGTRP